MLKPMVAVAATALLAIASGSYVYAQQGYGPGGPGGPRFERGQRLGPADRAAFVDARIAALKAGLQLTPDQEKNWPAFEQALRDMAKLRAERIAAREAAMQQSQSQSQTPPASPFDRLANRADALSKTSTALKHIADAGAPLYASLNDGQKARFTMLARFLRPHPMGGMRGMEENGRGGGFAERGWMGRRFGDNEGPGWGGRPFGDRDGPGGFHGRMRPMMQDEDGQDSRL
jgi:zinc resistance-associated protein